jgi:hypothetical protein
MPAQLTEASTFSFSATSILIRLGCQSQNIMNVLTNKIASAEIARDIRSGVSANIQLCAYEEYVTLWLWAYEQLLNWTRDIKWLFSPVTGEYPYPGDLWGIDSEGDLIIIEAKLGKKRQDPFKDLVGFEGRLKVENQSVFSEDSLKRRWQCLLDKEVRFIERCSQTLQSGDDPKLTFPGIVSYSSKRDTVWRWRHLYLEVIVPNIKGDYQQVVTRYLKQRSTNKIATQHYFGVILASSSVHPELSKKGDQNYEKLLAEVGTERVHLCFIHAQFTEKKSVLLKSEAEF